MKLFKRTPKVRVITDSKVNLPSYQTEGSAGMDLRACIDSVMLLDPGERKLIPTGLYLEIPKGYEAQIRPRSSLALYHGVTVLNSPGTIDSDYRGEIGVILINTDPKNTLRIVPGDRIAQIVFAKVSRVQLVPSAAIGLTARGAGGFGSTGKR